MGGVVEGGVGIGNKTSPRRAAIEKVQAELRQEYDVREERRKELEFLEKGGNPLDFKLGNSASLSVQSTSLTDQHPDQFVTSEAKGSFAASPHADSVESSGRPGAPPLCEPNSGDNLMLFDGDNEFPEVDRNLAHRSRSGFAPSEQSSQLDVNQNAQELKDSAAFSLPRKAYRRRSRPNRDGARTGSTDAALARGGHGSSLSSFHAQREVKGLVSDAEIQKDQNVSMNCNSTPTSPNRVTVCNDLPSDNQLEMDGVKPSESIADLNKGLPDAAPDANASKSLLDAQVNKLTVFSDQKSPTEIVAEGLESFHERQDVDSTGLECQPCSDTAEIEDQACCSQLNGFSTSKGDRKSLQNDGLNSSAAVVTKVLDSESSCTQTSVTLDGNNDSEMCTNLKNLDSNGNVKDQTLVPEETPVKEEAAEVEEKKETQPDDGIILNAECNSVHQSRRENGLVMEPEDELKRSASGLQNDVKDQIVVEGAEADGATGLEKTERKPEVPSRDNPITQSETALVVTEPGSIESSVPELPEATPSVWDSAAAPEGEEINGKVASKADKDSVLEEALVIEAKRKRIAELSVATFPAVNCGKSHWDYVLEEMAWLANDFAQERLWKITAAAQICHRVAFTSRLRFQEQNTHWEQKRVSHVLSKAVMQFWLSVEETSKGMELMRPTKDSALAIRDYAERFLKFNSSEILHNQAEAPVTPDRISDLGTVDMSWEDHWTEESLFYTIPSGATEEYRKLIESHVVQCEKTGNCIQEEVETSACDVVTDFGSQNNAYEEEEGETSTYDCRVSKLSRFAQRKRKDLTKGYGPRSYEGGADLMYTQCLENKVGTHQSVLVGQRSASNLNVSIPTKRVRTASRQRVISPFTGGTSGCAQLPSKTDASSGDTSSFQDDQSTLHGGSHMPNSMEVESVGDFEKQFPFDSTEVSKPRKKKKAKHMVSAYEQRWQVDSHFQNEQRDNSKKRSQSHQLESNGSSGLFGQHVGKKPKMMRPTLDTSFDNIAPVAGSVPSPVASQMSNMSNPNKLIKILGGRDRGRKAKALKVSAGQQGSGNPWSLFEDQALVVLVHDMGPNWELVSDAVNSTLQFKCIYRKPKECSERHKILMDRTSGDGADSAEDSGSSQPYPSTLPGIPKGSARQLFQRLQGPMEEDTLKSHFEKIIMIAQKQHYRKTQKNDNHDPKPLQQPHSSHMLALSQVCPNNLNGGPVLTPLDLCDATTSNPDMLGYQSPHYSGLAMSNQGTVAPMLPASGANPALHGSANMVLGNNFSSSPGSVNNSARDGRFAVPRSASLSIDEQQRMQQYNQMISSRNIQQPNLSAPGAIPGTDRGVRMLPGGNGLASVGGVNRSVPMVRPGFQAMTSSSMLNSGSMLSSGMVAMPSPVNLHSGPGRPRDAMHMMGNQDPQRQLMAPELQMQVSQANSQGVSPYGGPGSSFPNQTASPPVSSYPFHHQQSHPVSSQQPHMLSPHHPHLQGANHATNAQHQAYAIRLAKEKHLQQRLLHQQQQQQQQQQQFAASNALMPHVQPQSQLPISSPLHNSSQIQSQTTSPPASFSPLTSSPTMPQHQQKHHMPPHGHVRNSQTGGIGLTNQIGKQRHRQPQQQQQQQQFQQAGRHHPQQRQQSQSQQQTKLVKGVGRGNMVMQQNIQIDPSLRNGLSTNPGNQSNERGEQAMHLMQGQGLYAGSALNPIQNAKQLVPPNSSNQSQPQQNLHPSPVAPASKHVQQMPSHSDTSSQGYVTPVASGPTLSACHPSVPPLIVASSNNQQPQQHPQLQVQSHQKIVNQNPSTSQRVSQQNRQVNCEQPNKLQTRESQNEQRPMSNSSHISTAMLQAGNDGFNGTQVASCASQWKASEPLHDSATSTPATNLVSGTHLTNTAISEPIEGLGERQSSGSLPPIEHEVNAQWQDSLPQLQKPPSPLSQPQQQQEQLPPAQHS